MLVTTHQCPHLFLNLSKAFRECTVIKSLERQLQMDNYIDSAHAQSIIACNVLLTMRVLSVMPPKDLAPNSPKPAAQQILLA